jgi:hypothetical protein
MLDLFNITPLFIYFCEFLIYLNFFINLSLTSNLNLPLINKSHPGICYSVYCYKKSIYCIKIKHHLYISLFSLFLNFIFRMNLIQQIF